MPAPRPSRTLRAAGALLAAPVLVLAAAGAAWAHVTVSPTSAPQGSTQELTFKVPNEESGANTVSIQLQIPTADPIAQVLAKPVPGWTIAIHTVTLSKPLTTDDGTFSTAVDEVDWTGGSIVPGQYQDFSISVDPLPSDATELVFKAVQTYSNGDVVRWIDLSVPGQPDPDHPAPVLALTPAGANGDSGVGSGPGSAGAAATAVPPAAATTTTTTTTTTTSAGSTSSSSAGLGAAGLILGALGVLAAGVALWRTRRPAAADTADTADTGDTGDTGDQA